MQPYPEDGPSRGALVSIGLVGLALASPSGPDEPPARPRPGLTSQQTKEAVKIAHGAMVELRKKTEGASKPGADRREYVVGVELLSSNGSPPAPRRRVKSPAAGDGEAAKPPRRESSRTTKSRNRRRHRPPVGAAGDRDVVSLFR